MEEGLGLGMGMGLEGLHGEDELPFLDAHPRVLFSPSPTPPNHPPLLLMLETGMLAEEEEEEQNEVTDADRHIEGDWDRETDRRVPLSWADTLRGVREPPHPAARRKRSHLSQTKRGEMRVCDMDSVWVTDKKTAIDLRGQTVTILPEVQTLTGALKQYFYETRCKKAEQQTGGGSPRGAGAGAAGAEAAASGVTGVEGATCRGVDKKQWVSECKAKQTYVRALTKDANNKIGWRWIRIDSSCVCVLLSRAARHYGGRAVGGGGV